MSDDPVFVFGPFTLDQVLRKGGAVIELTPKAFGVLRMLVENAGQLVSKDALWTAVWPRVVVTDAAMRVCLAEVRKALGDVVRNPCYIATVHKRGYRFIAPVIRRPMAGAADAAHGPKPTQLVGRDAELGALQQAFQQASAGSRQLVFITGEAGIGKTAITADFIDALDAGRGARVAYGQCVEHFGTAEPYLPLLDAIARLCRNSRDGELVGQLARHAPLWLTQLPALLPDTESAALQHRVAGATRERMLRELAEFFEAASSNEPIVLCLEDLHWSDHATLDWLAYVARRPEPSRLLVIGTYRDTGGQRAGPALATMVDELILHQQCLEIALRQLPEVAVETYFKRRLSQTTPEFTTGRANDDDKLRTALVQTVHRRTGGNPLFMVGMVDYLLARHPAPADPEDWQATLDLATSDELGRELKPMMAHQLTRLRSDDLSLLEAASVAGATFSTSMIAAALGLSVAAAEHACVAITRATSCLRAEGSVERPDGSVASRYAFVHDLYRSVLLERIPVGRLVELHRAIAAGERRAYIGREAEIAASLALHYEGGRDFLAAAQCCLMAGQNALRRVAYADARAQFQRGLALLEREVVADRGARLQQELALQLALGPVYVATDGSATVEVIACYERAAELATVLGLPEQQFVAAFGLRAVALARGQLAIAHAHGTRLLALAEDASEQGLRLEAHLALGNTAFQMGALQSARVHLDAALALYRADQHRPHAGVYSMDPGMFCLSLKALVLELSGQAEAAKRTSVSALELADHLEHAYSIATAFNFAAWFHQLRETPAESERYADAAARVAERHGFTSAAALAMIRRGWARAAQGVYAAGVAELERGLAAWRQTGSRLGRPHFLGLLADCHRRGDRPEVGLSAIVAALDDVESSGERWLESELYRLRSVLILQSGGDRRQAEATIARALEIARAQGAELFVRRALHGASPGRA